MEYKWRTSISIKEIKSLTTTMENLLKIQRKLVKSLHGSGEPTISDGNGSGSEKGDEGVGNGSGGSSQPSRPPTSPSTTSWVSISTTSLLHTTADCGVHSQLQHRWTTIQCRIIHPHHRSWMPTHISVPIWFCHNMYSCIMICILNIHQILWDV